MAFQTDGTVLLADGTALAADGDVVAAEGLALASRHHDLPPAEVVLEPHAWLYCWYGPVETTTRPTTNTAKVITRGPVKGNEVTIDIELKEEAEERMADRGLRIVDDYGTPKVPGDDLAWKLEDAPIAYKRWFSCADAGHVVNTARLVDKWGKVLAEDSADVHVACYGLEVKKDAYTAFDRTYRWWIDKWADPGKVELWNGAPSKGWDGKGWDGKGWDAKGAEPACDPKDPKAPRGCDPFPCDPKHVKGKDCEPDSKATVDYKVKVWAEPYDSGHRAWGTIWIRNEHPKREAYVRDVRDLITGKYGAPIAATVKCAHPEYQDSAERKGGGDYRPWLRIPAGATVECTWYAKLPDGKHRWNTAYADLENHDFPAYGKPKYTGATTFEGSAAVDFDKAKVDPVDDKVIVKDSLAGTLGTVWAKDAPAWFRYSLTFAPGKYAPDCGEGKVKNTAWFKTFDTGATGEASAYVSVRVWCPDPKKPDPPKGDPKDPPKGDPKPKDPPAPPKYDPPAPPKGDHKDDVICVGHGHKRGDRHDLAWKRLGEKGLKTLFFDTGLTYWQVLKLAKVDRRAYFKLARTYVVAKLWALGGAEASADVDDALAWADGHFAEHGPNDQAARTVKAKRRVQRTMAEHGATLAEFAKSARKHCS